jgi:hypothetical protein
MVAAIHITTVTGASRALAALVLVLVAAAFVALVALHLLDRSVDPVSMAVSDYGVGDHAWFYRLAAIWLGLAGVLTAVIVGDAMYPKPSVTILCLLVFAAARGAITIFPTDLEGESQTATGRAHLVLAVTAFAAIAVAAAGFAAETRGDRFWSEYREVIVALGWTLPLVAAAMAVARRFAARWFGLVERLFYLGMFAWFGVVAGAVLGG